MPRPPAPALPSVPVVALALALVVALSAGPAGLVSSAWAQDAVASSGTTAINADQSQLDRIEARLDAILQKLGDGTGTRDAPAVGVPDPANAPGPAPASTPDAGPPAVSAGTTVPTRAAVPTGTGSDDAAVPPPADPAPDAESYRPGAIAVAHAAPTRGQPLSEIPADSIGGFIYTGGPIRLSDLSDRGVRYAGPAGIELQGWLKATGTGRHQIAADLQVRFGTGAIAPLPCTVSAWLEDQAIGSETRIVEPWGAKGEPISLSVVLGADLQPGLYKLRLWIACADLPPPATATASRSNSCSSPPVR